MILRCAAKTAVAMGGLAFLAGLGLGAASVAGALAAREAMKKRNSWRDDPADTLASSIDSGLADAPPL